MAIQAVASHMGRKPVSPQLSGSVDEKARKKALADYKKQLQARQFVVFYGYTPRGRARMVYTADQTVDPGLGVTVCHPHEPPRRDEIYFADPKSHKELVRAHKLEKARHEKYHGKGTHLTTQLVDPENILVIDDLHRIDITPHVVLYIRPAGTPRPERT